MKKTNFALKVPFNLQLFADEGTDPTTENNGTEPNSKDDTNQNESQQEPKYTEEDLDRIIGRKFAEWNAKNEKQQKEKAEAERLKNMTAEEKKNHEFEQMKEEMAKLKKEKALSAMAKAARSILADKNINVGDELIANLISESAEDTKAAVESFAKEFDAAVQKAVADKLKGKAPARGQTNAKISKEDILKITNRAERQKAIQENMDLFN